MFQSKAKRIRRVRVQFLITTAQPRSFLQEPVVRCIRAGIAASSLALLAACSSFTAPSTTTDVAEPRAAMETPSLASTSDGEIPTGREHDAGPRTGASYNSLWNRLRAGLALQEAYSHPEVTKQLPRFNKEQAYFDTVTARAKPFLYNIVAEAERRELPMELALLPFIESAFNPNAYSRQRAVGLWQFMSGTARGYGLRQDWWVDDRRDPLRSTYAALDYLESLHKEFDGDWLLALAAYNTGAGNVRRAQRRHGDAIGTGSGPANSQFWQLRLSGETRAHVPRLLALARVIAEPAAFEITLEPIANTAQLTQVDLERQIDLSRAAGFAEISLPELKNMNPRYLQWATPPDTEQWLYLPAKSAKSFREAMAQRTGESLVTYERYAIRSGDTLSGIARRLDTRVDVLQRVNGLEDSRIVAGRSLLIPQGDGALGLEDLPLLPEATMLAAPEIYTVKRGDNLWKIARRFQLRSVELRRLNALGEEALLKPGQKLRLLPAETLATD